MPNSQKGFTLIELMVVITIITILAMVGMSTFSTVQKNARDAKRKGDVDAITKALEQKYNPTTGYPAFGDLSETDFTGGKIPKPDAASNYDGVSSLPAQSFTICARLKDKTDACHLSTDTDCYCISSAQGGAD